MKIRLYNNRNRSLEDFEPLNPNQVTMYLCGPTVYNYVHIGNARGPVVFDVLSKLLRRHYPKLVYARNITDVDDKINAAAAEQNVPIATITDKFTAIYREDMAKLGVTPPDVEPHATDHIPQIITMIEKLIASNHAYAAEGHVLFSVASYADYGKLSRRPMDEMIAGARVDVAPYKRDAGDFVLWKPSTPELPGWNSPWGRGRPGWHIECSAMAEAHLGETIDIHAGGNDLLFPHHENEVAQSTCAHGGKVFARFWIHNGMLDFGGTKMSKSLGNVSVLHSLLENSPPEALRYALLTAHYRQPLDWTNGLIEQSVKTLDRLYGTLRDLQDITAEPITPAAIETALCDDLNTPIALSELARIAGDARKEISYVQNIRTRMGNIFLSSTSSSTLTLKHVASALTLISTLPEAGIELTKDEISLINERTKLLIGINQLSETELKTEIEKINSEFTNFHIEAKKYGFINSNVNKLVNEFVVFINTDNKVESLKALMIADSYFRIGQRISRNLSPLKAQLLGAGELLGLLEQDPLAWFARGTDNSDDARIQALVDERNAAKKAKDFGRSDAIRDELAAEGILLEDTAQGVRWRRA